MDNPANGPAAEPTVEHLIAADGGKLHPTANTLADFVRMVEDGQFDADVTHDMREMAAELENMFMAQGGKLKATITLKFDLTREIDGYYLIAGTHSIKLPKVNRKRSLAWLTQDNLFTPQMPNQGSLFGTVRDVAARRAR